MLNNEAQKCSIESTTSSTTERKCGGISRAKPLMTNADQASVRLSGRADCHDFQQYVPAFSALKPAALGLDSVKLTEINISGTLGVDPSHLIFGWPRYQPYQ